MRLIGSLASGEVLPADVANDGLMVLNGMLDTWQIERLMLFAQARIVSDVLGNPFQLVGGQQSYSVGTNGDFNIPRPARIDHIGIINLNNPNQPLELPLDVLTSDQWQVIPVKNIQSALPTVVWNDLQFPYMNLSYWPVPNTQLGTALYPWVAITQFADLVTDYTFPPGYNEAIRYNLAARLMAEFPGNYAQQTMQSVPALAISTIAAVKSFNSPTMYLYCDPILVSPDKNVFNWYTGTSNPPGGR